MAVFAIARANQQRANTRTPSGNKPGGVHVCNITCPSQGKALSLAAGRRGARFPLAGTRVLPGCVVAYTSAHVWHRSLGKPPQTGRFRLDVWSPTGDAAKQGEPHTGVSLTGSAVFGYTGYLRCTLTSSVPFLPLRQPLWGLCRGAFGVRAVIVPRQVRKDPCWQHRAAPPPRILVPAACPSRGSTNH